MPLDKLEGVELPAAADMHVHLRENEMMELVTYVLMSEKLAALRTNLLTSHVDL